jgi:hypothetical protein
MQSLTHQRCFNHSQREAAARCVGCRQFFCLECVTEHDDRVLCAVCLQKLAKPPLTQHRAFVGTLRFAQCLASVMLLWFVFYLAGCWLLSMPAAFHEGTLWKVNWFDSK